MVGKEAGRAHRHSQVKLRPNQANLKAKNEWVYQAGGWTQFILQLFRLKLRGLSPAFKLVLISILDRIRGSGGGGAFPSLETVAEDTGLGRATVCRALMFWREKRVLAWAKPNYIGAPNEYLLLKSPLTLPTAQVMIRIEDKDGSCIKMRRHVVSNWDAATSQNDTVTNTKYNEKKGEQHTGFAGGRKPETGIENLVGYEPGREDVAGGDEVGANRNFKTGGGGTPDKPRNAFDLAAEEEERRAKRVDFRPVTRVWEYAQKMALERMGVDLPALQVWEAKHLATLISTDGYGEEVVKAMVDTLTLNWGAASQVLKLKEQGLTWKTFVFNAQQLRGKQGQPFGTGSNRVRADLDELAAKASGDEYMKQRLAQLQQELGTQERGQQSDSGTADKGPDGR